MRFLFVWSSSTSQAKNPVGSFGVMGAVEISGPLSVLCLEDFVASEFSFKLALPVSYRSLRTPAWPQTFSRYWNCNHVPTFNSVFIGVVESKEEVKISFYTRLAASHFRSHCSTGNLLVYFHFVFCRVNCRLQQLSISELAPPFDL